jgi:hypothetical protein
MTSNNVPFLIDWREIIAILVISIIMIADITNEMRYISRKRRR